MFQIDNKLAGFDDTLGSSEGEMDGEGVGDHMLDDDQVHHSDESCFVPKENNM